MEDEDDSTVYVPLKQRRAMEEARRAAKRGRSGAGAMLPSNASSDEPQVAAPTYDFGPGARAGESLFDQTRRAMEAGEAPTDLDKQRTLEREIMAQVATIAVPSLISAKEHAEGIKYTEALRTDWRPPRHIRDMTKEQCDALRAKWHILVDGTDVPPPIKSFTEMRLPRTIVAALKAKKPPIERPTPIQVQGLPVALAGRDMIGIAFTGSGKTLVFTLPLVMWSWQEELRMPLVRGEGPIGIILAPSRELARQTYDLALYFAEAIKADGGPSLRAMLAIGGEALREQMAPLNAGGCHMIIGTPGRLIDHLTKKRITLDLCKYMVLDEGDRMLDMGFDEDIKTIFSYFKSQRQTVIFSATMPKTIQDFARATLVAPVTVNVGRAGAANLDVIQEVEYVKQEAKILYLLTCLQKTAPPVLIFAENKKDVDDIHEYLLLKGVAAVSVHGGKSQEERNESIRDFKAGSKDVLVATDVAAKGLDFPDIQHVINFDMPKEIENYVHRIGRTGRCGKTGVASTFINKLVDEHLLLDLKHLLIEAKQRVPPVLLAMEDPTELHRNDSELGAGCGYCGGLGHRITDCPKLDTQRKQLAGPRKDLLAGGSEW